MGILPVPGLQDEVVSMLRITRPGSLAPRSVRARSRHWLRATTLAAAALGPLLSSLTASAAPAGDLLARHSSGAPSIPSPFLRLYTMVAFTILAYLLQWLLAKRKDHRMAMRHGMAAGFVLSGLDHFAQAEAVYIPMLPDFLKPHGLSLVYISGVTELMGSVGLVVPLAVYRYLGLPNLRKLAGVGIALMLATLMIANIDIAIKAARGHHYAFAVWMYYLRLLFQPLFILWALYCTEVILAAPSLDSVPMKLFLLDQHKRLERFFPVFKPLAMSYDSHTVLREKVTSLVVPGASVTDLTRCDLNFLFDYVVFPPDIMKYATEWKQQSRAMQKGDIIIQQASVPPIPVSLKMVFAVRVVDMFRSPTKVGFSYGTLKGHAEMGISEFYFSIQDGVVRANIHTYSAPGAILTRMVAPFLTLPYQQYCTNRALRRMSESFLSANSSPPQRASIQL